MENPAHGFSTGTQMSREGNGDHSNHGCDSSELLSCALPSTSSVFDSKSNTITLINDIAHDNTVCFNASIQDGDQTDLFYNIVCSNDLPVGENVSICSPLPSETTNDKYNDTNMVFPEGVNSFPPVDVVVQGMDESLDNLALSVPDFRLKNPDPQSDDLTIQMVEQQKKLNESISAIAKSLGLEDLIPETFNVENNKEMFSVAVPSDGLEKEKTSPLGETNDFKHPVETHLSDLPLQFAPETDLLDCYDTLSLKKKCAETEGASFTRVPVVMSDGSTGYVVCSKNNGKRKYSIPECISNNPFMNSSVDNMSFQDLEDPDPETSDFVTMSDSIENINFTAGENDEPASNVICAETIECVLQTETSATYAAEDTGEICDSILNKNNIAITEVGDLLSKVLEQSPHAISAEPATISISTDNANKKMQIVLMTSQGQQVIEIDTDNLGMEPVPSNLVDLQTVGNSHPNVIKINNVRTAAAIEQALFPNEICQTMLDDVDEELTCEEDLVEFVKKITPTRGKRKSWVCPVEGCGQVLNKECKLRVHMISHKGARPYKCTVDGCDWAFTTPYRLRRHCETHVGKKDYLCDYEGCGRKFTTVYNLKTHKKRHVWPNSLTCPAEGCDMSFGNRRKLELHLRVHDDIEAPYSCSVCGKKYYSANCIASHYRTHQYSEDDFRCPFESCRKKYDKFCRLKQHIRHHTGERPYACPTPGCKWSFMSASKLTRHMRKHTGERKFVCTEPGCGKSFMRPEHLKGHVVIHSGDKPFQCPHENCNARFTAKSSLYVHVKKHCASGLKIVYPCPVTPCLKKYNNRASLKQHIQKLHPNILQDGRLIEIPEKFELTVPVSLSTVDETRQNNSISPVVITSSNSLKDIIRSMPTIVTSNQPISVNNVKVCKTSTSKLKDSQKNFRIVVPNSNRTTTLKSSAISSAEPVSERLQQENCSGSARTDYCCNRIVGTSKKLWTLQNRAHLGMVRPKEDARSLESSSHYILPQNQCSTAVRSPDVLLASSSVALHDPGNEQLVQTSFLQDDPSSSSIYHEDSILANNSEFVSELNMNTSLLSGDSDSNSSVMAHSSEAANFSASSGVDDFSVSVMNLQCLE